MDLEVDGGAPRIAPLPPRSWPAEMREALAPLKPPVPRTAGQPKALNLLGTLALHPELARSYHLMVAHLLYGSTLSPRHRELVILRVAAVRGAAYEWAQHVVLALDVGLSREEIAAVGGEPGSVVSGVSWSPLEGSLLAAVGELVETARISDASWRVLAATFSEQQLMDLVFTVGAYDMLAMAMRTFGVQLDDDLRAWVAPQLD